MKYDVKILDKYVEDGLLMRQKHPVHPIWIYNYTRTCQFENIWDGITLAARGLVIDEDGVVISKPFSKFFNYEQLASVSLTVPDEPFEVFEKCDGSLIETFVYKGERIFASKGSFTSDYAVKAAELMKSYPVELLSAELTYCFELLWTEHPIVIIPEKDDLILLGAFNPVTDEEVDIQTSLYKSNFNVVKRYDEFTNFKYINKLKESIGVNREGYVVRFKNGFRMKIKGEDYLRLHRIVTNISTIDIWKALKDGANMEEFFQNVPDEFDRWVRFEIGKLEAKFDFEWLKCVDMYNKIYNLYGEDVDMKTFSDEVKKVDSKYQPILYNIHRGNASDYILWMQLKPTFAKPNF